MPRQGSLRWAHLIILLILAAPGVAHAQEPECPANSSSEAQGEIVGINSIELPINLAPCQMLSVSVTTWDDHPTWGAAFQFKLCNTPSGGACTVPTHTQLDVENWSILNNPVTKHIPFGAPWVPPYRGTRGQEGLPVRATFATTSNVAGRIFYQITISKLRREGYNRGGTGTGNAPLVTWGTVYRGSIHEWEPGQYFKVHLEPNQGFAVAGTVLGHENYGPYWEINIRDAAHTLVKRLVFGTAYGGPHPFSSNVYTNSTGAPRDLYVQFLSKYYPIHDFAIAFEAPKLTLYLDADNNFNPDSPQDDSPDYLPCSTLDGKSVQLHDCPQTVKVIGAYTVGEFIVKPPTTGAVTFTLQDTSAFTGVAMNYPSAGAQDEADFAFPNDAPSVQVSFAPNARTVSVNLISRDYGGLTTVKANNAVELKVPRRLDNLLPENGWKVFPTPLIGPFESVSTSHRQPADDIDDTPVVVGPPTDPEGRGLLGDGLAVYEEYRGFIKFGAHIRTHPDKKDLFIAGDNDQAGGFGIGYAASLPLKVHHICDPSVATGCGNLEYSTSRVVNANRGNATGNPISGNDQRGVRVVVLASVPPGGTCLFGEAHAIGSFQAPDTSPNEIDRVEVYRDTHDGLANAQSFSVCGPALTSPLSAAEVQEAMYESIGHEVGHAVNICHVIDITGGTAYACVPGSALAIVNPVVSVMYSPVVRPIPSVYSQTDIGQIRLHLRQ